MKPETYRKLTSLVRRLCGCLVDPMGSTRMRPTWKKQLTTALATLRGADCPELTPEDVQWAVEWTEKGRKLLVALQG